MLKGFFRYWQGIIGKGIREVAQGIGDSIAIPSYWIAALASIASASSVRGLDNPVISAQNDK